ncbi:MAG: hypothetical protein ACF8XB_00910 [Planctomycetota bacterium JB042]
MVRERWALKGEVELEEGVLFHDGGSHPASWFDRVRVLEEREVGVKRAWLELLRDLARQQNAPDVVGEIDGVLPAPPEPPTYEESIDMIACLLNDRRNEDDARALLARAEAAKRNES